MRMSHRFRLLLVLPFCLSAAHAVAQTANSVVIWPIDPTIENDARASALWLENTGSTPTLLQIRILGWNQTNGEDKYSEQKDVTATPPMVRIEAGQRQLVRITRMAPPVAGQEQSYRVLIDEVPMDGAPQSVASGAGAAIRFRMRYSLPLFVYGEGIGSTASRKRSLAAAPALQWRTVELDGRQYLEIHNGGTGHARLSELSLRREASAAKLMDGIAGYVLPGATRRWPLEDGIAPHATLNGTINGAAATPVASWNP